jgi:hypothetical protein
MLSFFRSALAVALVCVAFCGSADAGPFRRLLRGPTPECSGPRCQAQPAAESNPLYAAVPDRPAAAQAAVPVAETAAFRGGADFHRLTRLKVAAALRKQGHSLRDARELSQELTDKDIDAAASRAGVSMSAIGDGKFLQAIIDFLKSPAGQKLIDLLIGILINHEHDQAVVEFMNSPVAQDLRDSTRYNIGVPELHLVA